MNKDTVELKGEQLEFSKTLLQLTKKSKIDGHVILSILCKSIADWTEGIPIEDLPSFADDMKTLIIQYAIDNKKL